MPTAEAPSRAYSRPLNGIGKTLRAQGRKIFASIVIVLVIATLGFLPELRAMAWHARHGQTLDFAGVRFRVPRLSYVTGEGDGRTIVATAGVIRHALGVRASRLSLGRNTAIAHAQIEHNTTGRQVAMRRAALVGSMIACTEYEGNTPQDRFISCERASSGPVPAWSGPASKTYQFYRQLAAATSIAAPTSADAP